MAPRNITFWTGGEHIRLYFNNSNPDVTFSCDGSACWPLIYQGLATRLLLARNAKIKKRKCLFHAKRTSAYTEIILANSICHLFQISLFNLRVLSNNSGVGIHFW